MRKSILLLSTILASANIVPALAQSDADTGGFETVIVTARKIAEDAQTVPISITALTAADLSKLDINTTSDLQSITPSFAVQPSTFRQDTLDITVRGQRNFDSPSGGGNTALDFDPSLAIYQDGVYYARSIGITGQMFDLQSVDVLKGPQGTLVGRNSTGGAILMTSREPTQDFGGYVKATGGDYDQYGFQGAINIPITDNLAVRAAISATGEEGIHRHLFRRIRVSGLSDHQAAMGAKTLQRAASRPNGGPMTASACWCAPTFPPNMTQAPALSRPRILLTHRHGHEQQTVYLQRSGRLRRTAGAAIASVRPAISPPSPPQPLQASTPRRIPDYHFLASWREQTKASWSTEQAQDAWTEAYG